MSFGVPTPMIAAVGKVTLAAADVEGRIAHIVWMLIADHQRIGQIITSELSARATRTLLMNLFHERFGKEDPQFERIDELVRRAETLEQQRNAFVHSEWGYAGSEDAAYRFKHTAKGKGLKFAVDVHTVEQIDEVAKSLQKLSIDLVRFGSELVVSGKAPVQRLELGPNGSPRRDAPRRPQ